MVHIGIIPDGNRRWCKINNHDQIYLLEIWLKKINKIIKCISNNNKYIFLKNINEISIYICSIDNLKREDKTKYIIFKFIEKLNLIYNNYNSYFKKDIIKNFENSYIHINFIGDLELLPENIQEIINNFKKKNNLRNVNIEKNKIFTINLAVAYNYHNDLLNYSNNNLENYNRNQSNIDLIFRSGKENRISGFFPTKILYSEIYFSKKYWPDITLNDLNLAIKNFLGRERRFGK